MAGLCKHGYGNEHICPKCYSENREALMAKPFSDKELKEKEEMYNGIYVMWYRWKTERHPDEDIQFDYEEQCRFLTTIDGDRKRIAELEQESIQRIGELECVNNNLNLRIADLEAEIKRLRDTLDYYACNALEKYPGRRAREALRPQKEE